MLIAFSVENFRSIRDLQTLSIEESRSDEHLQWSNTFEAGQRRVLKTAAIYGPNASGKSNVLGAMKWFREFVLNSSKEGQVGDLIPVVPFRLSTETERKPSHFEVEFFWEEHEYRYGFTVTSEKVESEWLFRRQAKAKPARLFIRKGAKIECSPKYFKEGRGIESRTRPNALFLSVCAQWNVIEAANVLQWIMQFRCVSGLQDAQVFPFTAKRLTDPEHRQQLTELARQADLNIIGLRSESEEITEAQLPDNLRGLVPPVRPGQQLIQTKLRTTHEMRNGEGEVIGQIDFDLLTDESQGTQKFIALSGPITHTLEEGSILVVDELDARLHPCLTQAIVDLFHSPANRNNAQLIVATHDVTLLEPERFRRDQIWFCEKDEAGSTNLYSLAEFDPKDVRPDTKFSRRYMQGLFGAIPRLAHFQEAAEHAIAK